MRARTIVRTFLVVAGAILALWLTIAVTMTALWSKKAPELVLKWAPFAAEAQASRAMRALQREPTRADMSAIRRDAWDALKREPINLTAVTALAVSKDLTGDRPAAERLFNYAQRLSRRDLLTQLWMIEREVARGSIKGALKHFDIALRTSSQAPAILIPILLSASADPQIAEALRDLLGQKPPWWRGVVTPLVEKGATAENAVLITDGLLDPATDRDIYTILLNRLGQEGRFELAWRVYSQAKTELDDDLVRNGDFEAADALPIFDWTLVTEPDLSAIREPRVGGSANNALHLLASSGRGGQVARQLLALKPGRHRVDAIVANVTPNSGAAPVLQIACADPGSATILDIPFPETTGPRSLSKPFSVPANGCRFQWLTLSVSSDGSPQSDAPWIDDLRITPL